jgi:Heparinase II/III N-terminus/Heparinase II/III-like protein
MIAVLQTKPHVERQESIFLPPFARLGAEDLLAHFRNRRDVHFFAVPDADETRREKIDAILENRFEFNGECHRFPDSIDWLSNPSLDVEWHILMHKFYYAVGLGIAFSESGDRRYLEKWQALTQSWIEQTPLGFIAADVTGRRVQNWIYAYHCFVAHAQSATCSAGFHRQFLESIAAQVNFLCENLTPARNHRTLELYAIFLAGVVFPELRDAKSWVEFALPEIARNTQTDLLPDGVQCELSTDYHHLVVKNYLCVRRLVQLNGISVPAAMDERLIKALEFSMYVHKPDGIVPSLSDGDARSFLDLLQQGAALYGRDDMLYVATRGQQGTPPAKRSVYFRDSGYSIVRGGWGDDGRTFANENYLVFDCGPLGAGNHGHFDCLNFELAAFGRSLIVDPGRYTYSEAGEINWRVKFRGSAFHNTVVVDGKNQTRYEPRAIKEVSRHGHGSVRHKVTGAAPDFELRAFESNSRCDFLHGVARSQEYDVVHERRLFFAFGEYWICCDSLQSPCSHDYELFFHLSEQAQDRVAIDRSRGTIAIESPNLLIAQEERYDALHVGIQPGFVSYRYGEKKSAPVVRFKQSARNAEFQTVLFPFDRLSPDIRIREMRVVNQHNNGARAHAFSIAIGNGELSTMDYCFYSDGTPSRWSFGSYVFTGTFLLIRKDAYGEIVGVHANPGAHLSEVGVPR